MEARRGHRVRVQATVVFIDVVGFTPISEQLGAELAYGHVTAVMRLLDEILRRRGGFVDKYLGDAIMAVFGYPQPRPDAPSAAIRAALEIRQRVEEYDRAAGLEIPLGVCIGINTGSITAGDAAGPVIREFHMLGDAVNTAARIKSQAPIGGIYVGPETCAQARSLFEFESLGPIPLKGKQRPVEIHRVAGLRPGSFGIGEDQVTGELVGRQHELARLREHAARLARGSGGIAVLLGEEGIGKSRLLTALASSQECEPLRVLASAASSLAPHQPFQALAGLVRAAADRGQVPRALRAILDPREGTPGLVEARVQLERLLRSLAEEQPLVVLLDELQWADPASIDCLPSLLRIAAELPVLVVLALRPDPGSPGERLLALLRDPQGAGLDLIALEPLPEADSLRLLERLSGDADLSDEARGLVLARAAGNPRRLSIGSFLAGALRSQSERERAGDERSSETERRYATVLFADLTGFTALSEKMEADAIYPVVSECLALLRDIAHKHGGTVDKYLGDCVLALFGIPRAIEDAPRAALNAAIEMIEAVRRYSREHGFEESLDLHVGINTGLGIAGEISGPLLREFAVMGDPVVIASALTDHAARGQIFVGSETHRFTRDDFAYRPAQPLRLKGRSEPIETFELVSRVKRLHRARVGSRGKVFSPLVGRDREMGALEAALERLRSGEGGILSLIAEAGVGKSRLVAELRQRAAGKRISWCEGRAISTGQQQSYHPFADLCRTWAGVVDEDDEDATAAKLRKAVEGVMDEETGEIFPFIGAITSARLDPSERDRLERIQGESLERLIHSAIMLLLRRASAEAPVVVVLDDLHWADQSSIGLLEVLLRLASDHPILFVHVFRPGYPETSGRILEFVRRNHPQRHLEIRVEPLDRLAARELIKQLFREGDVPQVTRAAIEEKTKGNPFYIEEVVRTLVDLGAVEYKDGSLHATEQLASVEIPGTVQEAVMARVDRLGLAKKSVLQAASVIGGSFHVAVLEEMVAEARLLPEILEVLEAGEFIVPTDRSAGLEFAFKHPLIQEVTYDGILEARRRSLHLEVARATERRLTENVPGFCAMLAYHFSMGRDAEHAEEYLFRAGDQAARMAAASEALFFFRRASQLYLELHGHGGDSAKHALLEKNLAQALFNRGQLLDAVEHFDRAAGLLGARISRRPVAMLSGFAWNLVRVLGDVYLPLPRRRLRRASPSDKELFDVMFKRAMAQSTTAPRRFFVDCVALLRRLLVVDPYTVPEAAAMYSGVVAIFAFGGLSFGVSRRFIEIARDLAESGAVDKGRLYYRVLTLMHYLLEGDWSDRHDIEPELIEEGIREGRFWEVCTGLNLLGVKRTYQGDFARTREVIEQLAKLAEHYEHDLAASGWHAVQLWLHVERRELPEALRAIELYRDEHREPLFNLQAFATRAKVEALAGEYAKATGSLERADALLAKAGRTPPWHASTLRSARYLADVSALESARKGGDEAATAKLLRRAAASRRAALATAAKVAWRRPEVLRLAGREAWLAGRREEALDWWRRGIACCQQLGARPELGRTWQAAGEALSDWPRGPGEIEGRDAAACLDAARQIFVDLDLAWDLARLPTPRDA